MPRPARPVGPGCEMVFGCPRVWVEFIARDNQSHRHIESKRSCRQHVTTAIAHMQTIANARIEVRAAR